MDNTQSNYSYKVGGGLRYNHPTYVWRQADQQLYDALSAGEFCYVFDARQMGKSSLRVQTAHRLQLAGVVSVSIDLTTIGSETVTAEQWYRGIFFELMRKFHFIDQIDQIHPNLWWENLLSLSPIQRLSRFMEEILFVKIADRPIVICFDEIDYVLSLNFSADDFFAFIRHCYEQRSEQSVYRRLTFALFGVATPPDLMRDKKRTPFNIGTAIKLNGFRWEEVHPLTQGLVLKAEDPFAVLHSILDWTGGQPFLTQKLCQSIALSSDWIAAGQESDRVEQWVRSTVIENWEIQDEPEHLRTIRDFTLRDSQRAVRLLGLYQRVLRSFQEKSPEAENRETEKFRTSLAVDDSTEQMQLLLSGLVVRQQNSLVPRNRIYQQVFDLTWVSWQLNHLRPYSTALNQWVQSGYQDETHLLQKQALKEAQGWAAGKSLSDLDYQFLAASQLLDRQQRERRILETLSILSYRGGDLKSYLQTIAKGVSDLFDIDWSVVTLCQEGSERVLASSLDMGEAINQMYSLHGTLTGTVIRQGRPLVVEDATTMTEYGAAPEGYRAYMGVPLRTAHHDVIGTICSFHHEPRHFNPEDIQFVELFAERAATAIDNYQLYQRVEQHAEELQRMNVQLKTEIAERLQVEAQLRQSEEQLRQIAENLHQVLWMYSQDGQPIYISPAFETIWQLPCSRWYVEPEICWNAIHPDDRDRVRMIFNSIAQSEYQQQYRIIRPDGSIRIINDQAFPIRDASGKVYRFAGIAEDITERVQDELHRLAPN